MPSQKAIETRSRIAAAALALLREKGASGLTMRGVATRCGLSLSNVQYHYGSRQALLTGLAEHHLTLCQAAMEAAITRAGPLSLRTVLEASLLAPEVRETVPPFRELFALGVTQPEVQARLMAHYQASHTHFVALLGTHWDRPEAELAEVATLLMAAMEGAYLLEDATPVTLARLVDRLEQTATALLGPPVQS